MFEGRRNGLQPSDSLHVTGNHRAGGGGGHRHLHEPPRSPWSRLHDILSLDRLRLSTRITAIALLLVVAGAAVLYSVEEAHLREVYLNERQSDFVQTLQTEQLRLTQAIGTLRRDTLFLANTPPLIAITRDAEHGTDRHRGLLQIFTAFLNARPTYHRIAYVGADGRVAAAVENGAGGTTTVQPGQAPAGAERDAYIAATRLETGAVHLSDFDTTGPGGEPELIATYPVGDGNKGGRLGAVVIHMAAGALLRSAVGDLLPGAITYVADHTGRPLLDTTPSTGAPAATTHSITADIPALAPLFERNGPRILPLQSYGNGSHSHFLAAARIDFDPEDAGHFLLLAYRLPAESQLQQMAATPHIQLAIGVAVLLLVGLFALILLRRLFAPLAVLTAAAERITVGDRSFPLPPGGPGEIGRLADAIRTMLTELTGRESEIIRINTGLKQEVALRTQELSAANARLREAADRSERAKQRYQSLLSSSMDGVHVLDLHGNVVEANAAFARMLGYGRDELLRLNIADWDAGRHDVEWHQRLAGLVGRSLLIETVHRRKDGTLLDVEISCSGVRIGGQEYIYAASRDITLRKRAETMLTQHKIVIDTSQDGFWLADRDGFLLEANAAYARISGYSTDELVTMHISQLEAKERSREEVMAHIDRIIAHGCDRFETRHRRKDGIEIDIEISTTYMPESERFFVFCRDITERKQAEQALRVAAAAFETHDAIVITDAHANIIRVNHAFTDITGYTADEVIGRNPRVMSSGRHDREFFAAMWQLLLASGSWSGEIWDRRKNGDIYPKWLTITAVRDEQQQVSQYVAIFSDITTRKRAEEEIRNLAFYDPLTKLPNRRLLTERFRAALATSARQQSYGAVLFVDLDNFKTLNDTRGHDYGDLLLIEVADRLRSGVREMDTVARLGGDEFIVLVEGIGGNQAEAMRKMAQLGEKIRRLLAHPYTINGYEHHSSPSIGITLYQGNLLSVDQLLQHADMAMYQAKDSGRNAVRFFDPLMQQQVAAHAALENDLRNAISQRQLRLYYQMQVDHQQRPLGAEALLRWVHPERGMVMPDTFIPVAEESTLIIDIGQWVLETACRQLAAWAKNPKTAHLVLAINISARQFSAPNFVDKVAGLISAHAVNPALLQLELTETMVLRDLAGTVATMQALRNLGVKLSMDDFGTGYSSLAYLKQLPLDQLKIDREFVSGIATNGTDALLVQTIIGLAGNFCMDVIAEGVETEAQLSFLAKHPRVSYQGYYFGKPMELADFESLLH